MIDARYAPTDAPTILTLADGTRLPFPEFVIATTRPTHPCHQLAVAWTEALWQRMLAIQLLTVDVQAAAAAN